MSKALITEQYLSDIGDAIRNKNGLTTTYLPSEMASAISSIPSGGTTLAPIILRPDATKVASYTYDKMIVADEGATIPAYTTNTVTFKASGQLTPTTVFTWDKNCYIVEKFLAIPQYADGTEPALGRNEYFYGVYTYEVVEIPPGTVKSVDGNVTYSSRQLVVRQAGANYFLVYRNSAISLFPYSTVTSGVYMTASAPTTSTSNTQCTLTLRNPGLCMRGNTTYLRQAVWETIADIRYQYIIDVYTVPKSDLNANGWETTQASLDIIDAVNSNGGTLR